MPQSFVAVRSTPAAAARAAETTARAAVTAADATVTAAAQERSQARGAGASDPPAAQPADVPTAAVAVARAATPVTPARRGLDDFGPLGAYLRDDAVTDVFVNGRDGLWLDRGRGLEREASWAVDERSLRDLAVRLIGLGGRHVDEATPCVDVRLHDGVRVHAVLPPISQSGTLLSVRLPRRRPLTLADLRRGGMFDAERETMMRQAVAERRNILVTGAAGTGKTTLLGALLSAADTTERIVVIEDVAELRLEHPHVVVLEARQANLEGAGEVGVRRLLREALRMRPDRLVLGECRGEEVRELLAALNTGHDGGAGTVHANSLHDVPARLEAMGALAGMTPEAVARQAVSAIDLVMQLEYRGGVRRVAQTGEFVLGRDDRLEMCAHDPPSTAGTGRAPRHRAA